MRVRVALLNPPVPNGKFTNRDLMGGMGIDDGFGVGLGPRFVALLKNVGTRLPVISLAYSAAVLRKDHDVFVFDLMREDPESASALAKVVDVKPDWVIATTSFAFLGAELRFLERVREATGAKRMLEGYCATHFAKDILERKLAECVSSGDPEVAVQHLAAGTLRPGVDGVLMLDDEGRYVPAPGGYIDDLDTLPHPSWDGFPVDEYAYFPLLKQKPFLTSLSSRGCPYVCHFCPYPIAQGAPFRPRSAKNVVEELELLSRRHGVKNVLFRDPTFSLDMERIKTICRMILDRGIRIEFGIETRLDRMDEEMIDLLAKAGCRSAEFGVDPLDEETLKASKRKAIKPDRGALLIRRMEDGGIATAGLAVIGLPEQSADEVERTMEWAETLDLSYINYEMATPFPGTPLYDQAVAKGWAAPIKLDDLLEGDPKLGFNGVMRLDEIKKLQDRALKRFYLRPKKVAREIFNKDLLENVRFMASSGWMFVRSELGL
jgi:radical SAM superfamily enzyme YgiQ (UPF0313 family)